MTQSRSLSGLAAIGLGLIAPIVPISFWPAPAIAQRCASPVLDRLQTHTVSAGETLGGIAARYGLAIETLTGFNANLANPADSQPSAGSRLTIPPYNGVRVTPEPGDTWRDLADRYNVRADVLFELNGCGTVPVTVFIPGVARSPIAPTDRPSLDAPDAKPDAIINTHPLGGATETIVRYGWVLLPGADRVTFHSGVDLSATVGDPVASAAAGTVAFVGDRAPYGQLVVINHANGRQTRYAHLASVTVTLGQSVAAGETIGTVGQTGQPDVAIAHLHFEVRYASERGWIADDPQAFLDAMTGIPRSPFAPPA